MQSPNASYLRSHHFQRRSQKLLVHFLLLLWETPDDVSLPDLILDVQDEERFDDDSDLEVLSRSSSSSDRVQVIPSPTYRMAATSDVSTEILSPRGSPDCPGLSDSYSDYPSPDYGDFKPNPLAEQTWSSSDSEQDDY